MVMDDRKREPWLDGLRGAAVLLVLGRHLELPANCHPLLEAWRRGGWVGVDLFFVLSGFLVAGLLFREYARRRSLGLPRFLIRRALRILPAFFVLIACTWLLVDVLPIPHTARGAFLTELCFLQNYRRCVWPHTWSLAVEEHFYLALPIVLLVLVWLRRGRHDPFGLAAGVVVTLPMLRLVHAWLIPYRPMTHLYPTHLRVDALMAGVLLAYVYQWHRPRFSRWVAGRQRLLCIAGAACFVPAFVYDLGSAWFLHTVGLSLFALGSVLLIAAGLAGQSPQPIRWLVPVGGVSYSTYLWHMPVLLWGLPLFDRLLGFRLDATLRMGVYLVGSLLAGSIMAWLVERPMIRLRDRLLPAPTRDPDAPSVIAPQLRRSA
jgi:peptidoglycan/LPS O-acetylase OafA/YrhL